MVVAVVDLAWLRGVDWEPQYPRYLVILRQGRIEIACAVETVGRNRRIVPDELAEPSSDVYLCYGATLDGMNVIDGETLLSEAVLIADTEPDED
jgi:hypothetical protein